MKCLIWPVLFLIVNPAIAVGEDLPTSLTCKSNARTWRDYGFEEKAWGGSLPQESPEPFGIATSTRPKEGYPLRDRLFSGLNTTNPIVRSVTPAGPRSEETAAEFKGVVVGRTKDAVFILWSNDQNKFWLASMDLTHRKAAVAQVFQGLTSIGGEVETLDCQ